jgi:hypothetical protein
MQIVPWSFRARGQSCHHTSRLSRYAAAAFWFQPAGEVTEEFAEAPCTGITLDKEIVLMATARNRYAHNALLLIGSSLFLWI